MSRAEPRVLVTDAGRGSAISIIRSLGQRGVHVIASDSERRSPGFYSRYTQARVHYPPPRGAPREMVAALLDAARTHGVDLVIPVTDEVILPLSAARERFAGVCALALPEPSALAAAGDKLATLDLARGLGLPAPRSALVTTAAQARAEAPALGWPVVLKPRASRVYRDGRGIEPFTVAYAENEEALTRQMAPFEGRCPVLLQEYCRGKAHGVELLAFRGRPLAAFQHLRLREVPITGGASSFRESVPLDPTLYEQAARLLRALEWTGLAMVEFKVDGDGPRLMEINGRIWGSLPLAVKSGMDFPGKLVDLYLDGPPAPDVPVDTSYAVGVRSRNLELELVWIASAVRKRRRYPFLRAPTRRDGLAAALRLLHPGDGFDVLSRSDPRPGVAEIGKAAGMLRRKLGRAR